MSSSLLIWGAGGHGRVLLDIAYGTSGIDSIAFLDDDPAKAGNIFCRCPVLGGSQRLQDYAGSRIIIAVGDNHTRARCFEHALRSGLIALALCHPTAIIAPSATVGPGTVVMPGAIINAGAIIGENCIINTGAIVEHDCRISAHVHISPRVALGGGVNVGTLAHVGLGAVVLPGATLGEGSVVGAGAVVLREAAPHRTVVGVPAKLLSRV